MLIALAVAALAAPRPNIVLIMADDMGFSDAGCYGGEVQTPNLDRLAENGLRFTQFYNTSRCCPTRASLLTGLYPHQAGIGQMTMDKNLPGYRGFLTENTVTIAEVLREAGYRTAMVGKWHVSRTDTYPDQAKWVSNLVDHGDFSDPESYPVGRGFEEHYGNIWALVNFFNPFGVVHNTTRIREFPEDFYYTDALNEWSVKLLDKYGRGEQPFFLYIAHTAPHWPLHAFPEDIAKYEDTYKAGWDEIRERRYTRMVQMGILDPDTAVLSPHAEREYSWRDNPHQEWDARAMAVHAAMIDRLDQGLGQLVAKLEELGKLDETLILFLSDNGASPESPERGKPGFDRPSHLADGTPIIYTKDKKVMPGPANTWAGLGPMWANAANTPFRYWKREVYEGGIATPLVAHWPNGLRTEPGEFTEQPGHVIDLMATAVDLAGAKYPGEYKGRKITPLEGKSLAPIFAGEERDGHQAIYWEHFDAKGVRQGDWKLVAFHDGDWELYHLGSDRTETAELSEKYPDRVNELKALWEKWAKRTNVYPAP